MSEHQVRLIFYLILLAGDLCVFHVGVTSLIGHWSNCKAFSIFPFRSKYVTYSSRVCDSIYDTNDICCLFAPLQGPTTCYNTKVIGGFTPVEPLEGANSIKSTQEELAHDCKVLSTLLASLYSSILILHALLYIF